MPTDAATASTTENNADAEVDAEVDAGALAQTQMQTTPTPAQADDTPEVDVGWALSRKLCTSIQAALVERKSGNKTKYPVVYLKTDRCYIRLVVKDMHSLAKNLMRLLRYMAADNYDDSIASVNIHDSKCCFKTASGDVKDGWPDKATSFLAAGMPADQCVCCDACPAGYVLDTTRLPRLPPPVRTCDVCLTRLGLVDSDEDAFNAAGAVIKRHVEPRKRRNSSSDTGKKIRKFGERLGKTGAAATAAAGADSATTTTTVTVAAAGAVATATAAATRTAVAAAAVPTVRNLHEMLRLMRAHLQAASSVHAAIASILDANIAATENFL